jgi:hypothetical protein
MAKVMEQRSTEVFIVVLAHDARELAPIRTSTRHRYTSMRHAF